MNLPFKNILGKLLQYLDLNSDGGFSPSYSCYGFSEVFLKLDDGLSLKLEFQSPSYRLTLAMVSTVKISAPTGHGSQKCLQNSGLAGKLYKIVCSCDFCS